MIDLENASAGYAGKTANVIAVDNVSLKLKRNEITGIAGESGCGKSTLLKLIHGQVGDGLELFGGTARWRVGADETGADRFVGLDGVKALWWDKITYIPQAVNSMNPIMRLEGQLFDSMPTRLKVDGRAALRQSLVAFLERLGLEETVLGMFPFQLSGGMMQRVLIGLAAFPRPDLILADEPTTALDVVVQKRILLLLHKVQRELGNALVFVSHDLGVHYQISDRILICYAGKIVEDGPTKELFARPRHPYTRALISALPRVNDTNRRLGLDGRPPSLAAPPKGCRFAARCAMAQDLCRQTEPTLRSVELSQAACHFPLDNSHD